MQPWLALRSQPQALHKTSPPKRVCRHWVYTPPPVYEMNENIDIRVPLYFGSQNYKSTEGGTTIDGKVTSESVGVMLDYYSSGVGFASAAD